MRLRVALVVLAACAHPPLQPTPLPKNVAWCAGPTGGELVVALPEPLALDEARLIGSDASNDDWRVRIDGASDQSTCSPSAFCASFSFPRRDLATQVRVSVTSGRPHRAARYCTDGLLVMGETAHGEPRIVGAGVTPASAARLGDDLRDVRASLDSCDPATLARVAELPLHVRDSNSAEGERTDLPISDANALAAACRKRSLPDDKTGWADLLADVHANHYLARVTPRADGLALTVNPADTEGSRIVVDWRQGRWRLVAMESWGD